VLGIVEVVIEVYINSAMHISMILSKERLLSMDVNRSLMNSTLRREVMKYQR
jgi:hypothetical protein